MLLRINESYNKKEYDRLRRSGIEYLHQVQCGANEVKIEFRLQIDALDVISTPGPRFGKW